MKLFFTLFFAFVGHLTLLGQSTEQQSVSSESVPAEYNRNAMSVLVLENPNGFTKDFMRASSGIVIPDKFDDNQLALHTINSSANTNALQNELMNKRVVNSILAKWFSRDDTTGELNMLVIHERGMYNATDGEVLRASASKIGLAKLKDAGESLINRSYVLVLEFNNVKTMRQIYNKRDVAKKIAAERMNKNYQPVRRVKNGWVCDVKGHLFKLNFNDSVLNVFYNDLWVYEDDDPETKQRKKELFNATDFPIEFVTQVHGSADGSQYNPGHVMALPQQLSRNGLFKKMINTGLNECVEKIEKITEDFIVKAPVFKTNPISTKVGKKEGLKTDQRYFVLEFIQNSNGDLTSKRKAVVRVKKVTDNRMIATGDSEKFTTFYQVAGLGVDEGMLLYQKNDIGIGLSGGVAIGEIGGGWGKVEFNVARMASGIGDIGVTQLKVFGSIGFENKDYDVLNEGTIYDMHFIRWQVGISKGFYFARRFSLAPFVAFGAESGSNSQMNSDFGLYHDDFIGADYFNYGVSGNVNLLHFLQLYSTVNYILPFPYTYTKQRHIFDYSAFNNKKYTEIFEDRNGLSIDLGIRLEF